MSNLKFVQILSNVRHFAQTAADTLASQKACVSRITDRLPH
jgi:hypothetical protein